MKYSIFSEEIMETSRTRAWLVWIIISIFYAYQYILRIMPNIMINDILTQFNINTIVFGQFSGIYYLGYALMHLPIAILLDRFGAKVIMSLCVLLTIIGLIPMVFSNHWQYLLIGRIMIGIGSSAAILGILKIVRTIFNERIFTRMLSLSLAIGLIGGVYGSGPISRLYTLIGYNNIIILFILLGMILSFTMYLLIPKEKTYIQNSVFSDIKSVLTNYKLIAICCFGGLMIGPLEGFSDAWGNTFLKHIYHLDMATVGYLLSMIFIGLLVGLPILGYIGDKTQSYIATSVVAGFCMLIIFIALLYKALSVEGIAIGLFIVGVCSTYQNLIIFKASTYVLPHQKSLSSAVTNMIIMSFGYGFHTSIGTITNIYQENQTTALLYAISIIPIALALGIIGLTLLAYKERKSLLLK